MSSTTLTISKCSPGNNFNDSSCLSTNILHILIRVIYPDKTKEEINNMSREYIIEEINKYLQQYGITNELMLSSTKIWNALNYNIRTQIKESYKPIGPIDTTWLSNIDIENIFKQYMVLYKNFLFLGALPRDFDRLMKLSTFDFIKQNPSITKYAIIINHDKYGQSGSHWVALWFDIETGDIDYFDSVGKKPKPEIIAFIDQIKEYMMKQKLIPKYRYNLTQFQRKGSECGVYSCYFIIRMLEGATVEEIFKMVVPDDIIQMFRQYLFNTKEDFINPDKQINITDKTIKQPFKI